MISPTPSGAAKGQLWSAVVTLPTQREHGAWVPARAGVCVHGLTSTCL
jgi:hypothetical protein